MTFGAVSLCLHSYLYRHGTDVFWRSVSMARKAAADTVCIGPRTLVIYRHAVVAFGHSVSQATFLSL